jgi:VWFA-related protein
MNGAYAQTGNKEGNSAGQNVTAAVPRYNIHVAVDEVSLTFHAADAHSLPVNDLKIEELRLRDDGKPPRRIVAFQAMEDFPIRAGFLMDTSKSMEEYLRANRVICIQYAQKLLRRQTDQAFVMDFGYLSNITLPWTSDPAALTAGIRRIIAGKENPLGGTALFDSIYRACYYEFDKVAPASSGNFILLFSDGEDNASRTSLKQVVDICQRSNTAIYSFLVEPKMGYSAGPEKLRKLAYETGGRVFFSDDSEAQIDDDLRTIEADLRNQYRLIYNPAELKHDGSFHRVELSGPERVDSIRVRTGYYAPAQ